MKTKKIRWLIAHEPEHLFLRTATAMAQELEKSIGNAIEIEILTTKTYQEKYGKQLDNCWQVVKSLNDGDIEITQSQVFIFSFWNKNFQALDLPFLFRDHDHCTKVLEGRIGQTMCKSLTRTGNMRGLAFTYSGGFRVIGSNEPITSFDQLKNLRVRVNTNPVNSDTIEAFGANPRPQKGYGYDLIESGELDAAETTYLRFLGKHVLKTNHSMFMTTIAINETFFKGLEPEIQEALQEAAIRAARIERDWSIKDAEEFEKNCIENDVTITELSSSDKTRLRENAMKVYDKWDSYFWPGMIKMIQLQ